MTSQTEANRHESSTEPSTKMTTAPGSELKMDPTKARWPLGRAFVRCAFLGLFLFLGLAIFSYMGRIFFLAELFCNYRLQLLIALFTSCLALIGTGYRPRWAWVGIVGGVLMSAQFVSWQSVVQPPSTNEPVKVMSFNVLATNHEHQKAVDCIVKEDPDLVVVIEYANSWSESLKQLDIAYPHQIHRPRWHGFGMAIFSKIPFEEELVYQITREDTDNPFMVVDLKSDKGRLYRIAACHLLAPMDPHKMKIRNKQMAEVAEIVADSQIPTVLVGDFNCVPWSRYMTDLMKVTGLRDTRVGHSYAASWPTNFLPMRIPIDHALVSKDISISSRRLLSDDTGSDHFPLVLEFSLAELPKKDQ